MPYYAVIDTNVLVSAMLKWNSVPGNVIRYRLQKGNHRKNQGFVGTLHPYQKKIHSERRLQ